MSKLYIPEQRSPKIYIRLPDSNLVKSKNPKIVIKGNKKNDRK